MMTGDIPDTKLGFGQVALELDESVRPPADQVRALIRLSDPALSELEFDALLDELLVRARDTLAVDTAAILLLDRETDQLVARAAKGIEEEVEQGVRIPVGQGFAGRIAKERVAIFIADVDHADILNPILRQKGISSLLGVPLIVDGQLIGVLHIGSLQPRTFDLNDLAVLELVAARAAPAIERGRLIGELAREHRNAVMLQRSLLPGKVVSMPGVTVAARYLPARDEIGGDWYDTIELPRDRVGIAIGDVVGHGVAAAALMGQLRTSMRAYALDGNGPARTLELVDRYARSLREDALATAAYAVLDMQRCTITLASAGHLPPVIVSAAGETHVPEVVPAPPIGAFGFKQCREQELKLEPGDTLLFYTDGLIERPHILLGDSIKRLAESLRGAVGAEEICLTAIDRFVPRLGASDDVAVIAVQIQPAPEVLELELPAVPASQTILRQALVHWLRAQDLEREVATPILIAVSEACANAIEHAYSPGRGLINVHAERAHGSIEVTVSDQGRWRAGRGENRGRGLQIMQAAMDDLDISSNDDGTEVVMRRTLPSR